MSGGQAGFTLLEVLVAAVIAGAATVTLIHVASQSMAATTVAQHYQEAVSRARSRLDAVNASLMLGEQSGDDGGLYRWRTLVREIERLPDTEVALYATSVVVTWREGRVERTLRLDGKRLRAPPPS